MTGAVWVYEKLMPKSCGSVINKRNNLNVCSFDIVRTKVASCYQKKLAIRVIFAVLELWNGRVNYLISRSLRYNHHKHFYTWSTEIWPDGPFKRNCQVDESELRSSSHNYRQYSYRKLYKPAHLFASFFVSLAFSLWKEWQVPQLSVFSFFTSF